MSDEKRDPMEDFLYETDINSLIESRIQQVDAQLLLLRAIMAADASLTPDVISHLMERVTEMKIELANIKQFWEDN